VRPQSELADCDRGQVEAADVLDPAWRSVIAISDSGRPDGIVPIKPKRIALYYDASASARERQRPRERGALEAYFRAIGNVEVVLVAFRNDADSPAAVQRQRRRRAHC
jgi:hypothetical protein